MRAWLWVGALAACGGKSDATSGDDDDTPTDTGSTAGDDDDDDTPTDTGTTSPPLVMDAAYLLVASTFAYDADAGVARGYEDPAYGPLPLTLSVVFLDSSAIENQVVNEFNSCAVTLTAPRPLSLAPFVKGDAELWWGFEMPADAQVVDGCVGWEMPAAFGGDVAAQVTRWSWGIAVSEIDPAVEAEIEASLPEADYIRIAPYLIGGNVWSTAFAGVVNPEGLLQGAGNAYEADANFAPVDDGTGQAVGIPALDVWDGTSLARGIYSVSSEAIGPGEIVTF